jgi:chemotaxis protein CheC
MPDYQEYQDIICELVNIGAGKAGQILNQMFSSHINLTIPVIESFDMASRIDFEKIIDSDIPNCLIEMDFNGTEFGGCAMLLFKNDQVDILADALISVPYEDPARKSLVVSALSEIGNIVINALIGSISNIVKTNIAYSVPKCSINVGPEIIKEKYKHSGTLFMARTLFELERLKVDGHSIIFLSESGLIERLKIELQNRNCNEG